MASKCDIIRDGARAAMQGGVCGAASPPAACYVTDMATKRDTYFKIKYDPSELLSSTSRMIRRRELENILGGIDSDAQKLSATYGENAPTDISWDDFTGCLWNPNGAKGGPHGNIYFGRDDLMSLGYSPQPLVKALAGKIPDRVTDFVPVWLDRIFNPSLAVVFILLVLILISAALLRAAHRDSKNNNARMF